MRQIPAQTLAGELRQLAYQGALSGLLPLPALLISHSEQTADLACLYLGLSCAWLASEAFHPLHSPANGAAWRKRIAALALIISVNVSLFIFLGISSSVASHLPFALVAIFSVMPAMGLIPWLVLKLRHQFQAIVLGAVVVGATKLAGCILARIVYGPNALRDGFMAADWRTAPLMLSCFWAGTLALSLCGLIQSWRLCAGLGGICAEKKGRGNLAASNHYL